MHAEKLEKLSWANFFRHSYHSNSTKTHLDEVLSFYTQRHQCFTMSILLVTHQFLYHFQEIITAIKHHYKSNLTNKLLEPKSNKQIC